MSEGVAERGVGAGCDWSRVVLQSSKMYGKIERCVPYYGIRGMANGYKTTALLSALFVSWSLLGGFLTKIGID